VSTIVGLENNSRGRPVHVAK